MDEIELQVKCPECRAEHRIPYQGIQQWPSNVTLQRFLELHIEITGELPDPTSGQVKLPLHSHRAFLNAYGLWLSQKPKKKKKALHPCLAYCTEFQLRPIIIRIF